MDREISEDLSEGCNISIAAEDEQMQLTSDDLLQMFHRKYFANTLGDSTVPTDLLPQMGKGGGGGVGGNVKQKSQQPRAVPPASSHTRRRVVASTGAPSKAIPKSTAPPPGHSCDIHATPEVPTTSEMMTFELLPTDDESLGPLGIRRPDPRFYSPELIRSDTTDDATLVSVHSEFSVGVSAASEEAVMSMKPVNCEQLQSADTQTFAVGSSIVHFPPSANGEGGLLKPPGE